MAAIYLICGFMGFGKTTYAKKLAQDLPAVRYTHDEIMLKLYGRTPDDFSKKYKIVDTFIRQETSNCIKNGTNVILDYGFWSKTTRQEYYLWAKSLTPDVYFHALLCDIEKAKKRVLRRTKENPDELFIDENFFNSCLLQYEPVTNEENLPVIYVLPDEKK